MAVPTSSGTGGGPLAGIKVVEIAGKGPVPFCGMLLADLGAEVLRLDRTIAEQRFPPRNPRLDAMSRGRRSLAIDMKQPGAKDVVLRLLSGADALIEGFRPGVMERLGIGPEPCMAANPRLVYGRATGWGRDGPLSMSPGHDINYLALSGLLDAFRRDEGKPMPPLNVLGDYAGGGLMLAFGLTCALLAARSSGQGQVVDAAMLDGMNAFATLYHGLRNMGQWDRTPGSKVYDTAAPYYDCYRCADGKYISVGAIEARFYQSLLEGMGLDPAAMPPQNERAHWAGTKSRFARIFATRTRDAWCQAFAGSDACVAPVLSLDEAPRHPHNVARQAFLTDGDRAQPAPAPRFTRTPGRANLAPPLLGEHTAVALADWGFTDDEIDGLRKVGVVLQT